MITSIHKSVPQGRRNIPRYLYHLTNKDNYNSMLKDGFININHDCFLETNISGIFMFEMANFIKRWVHSFITFDDIKTEISLAKSLFAKIGIENQNLVLLKIPTKKLNKNNFLCRVQSRKNPEFHQNNGDIATNQKHYTRKKLPIEYIYTDNIEVDKVSKIGEVKIEIPIEEIENISEWENMNFLDVFSKLLKGQPEEKAVKLAQKSSIKFIEII